MPPEIFSKKSAYASLTVMAVLMLICSACSHKPVVEDSCRIVPKGAKMYDLCIDQKMIGKPHDTVVGNRKSSIIDIYVWFRNNSNDSLNYMDWSGYRESVFTTDNKKINFLPHIINANMLSCFTVKAHQMERCSFHLEFNKDSIYTNNQFRIGMDIIKVGNEGLKAHFIKNGDTTRFKRGNIIWSNPVKVPLN